MVLVLDSAQIINLNFSATGAEGFGYKQIKDSKLAQSKFRGHNLRQSSV